MHEFMDLRGTAEWCTTLAYWLGVARSDVKDASAESLAGGMSYQYDIEEQAGYTGYVFNEDAEWRRFFTPVAPVQVARAWSPFATAERFLGPPAWKDVSPSTSLIALAAAWFQPEVERSRNAVPRRESSHDERRFLSLLAVAGERSARTGAGVLLVAQPGWSYDSGCLQFDPETSRLMRREQFAVVDRRPGLPVA